MKVLVTGHSWTIHAPNITEAVAKFIKQHKNRNSSFKLDQKTGLFSLNTSAVYQYLIKPTKKPGRWLIYLVYRVIDEKPSSEGSAQ